MTFLFLIECLNKLLRYFPSLGEKYYLEQLMLALNWTSICSQDSVPHMTDVQITSVLLHIVEFGNAAVGIISLCRNA